MGGTQGNRLLSGKAINDLLPELELRGRSQRLGKLPLFLSFESSIAGFRKQILGPPEDQFAVASDEELETTVDNSWMRLDFAPRLRLPLLKTTWGDAQITAGWRGTWYSHRVDTTADDTNAVISDGLGRSLWSAGLSFDGPRFQRVFKTPKWSYSPKLKHVIEPFVSYQWRPEASIDAAEVIRIDEIDTVPGELSDLRFGIRQRFFALRPPQTDRPLSVAATDEVSFEAIEKAEEEAAKQAERQTEKEAMAERLEVKEQLNPMEFASLEVYQSYSLVRELSSVYAVLVDPDTGEVVLDDVTGNPLSVRTGGRHFSPITIKGRFNPTETTSMDMSYTFDPANSVLTETRISALIGMSKQGFFQGSWYRRQSANPGLLNASSFLRTRWGMTPSSRFSVEVEWDYDLENSKLQHQAYHLRWATQCCAFKLGFDKRDFTGNTRKEFRLVVDLTGIGEILNLKDSR